MVAKMSKKPTPSDAIARIAGESLSVEVPAASNEVKALVAFEINKKSVSAAFILSIFLGMLGGHRFYLGFTGTAILMFLLTITVVGSIISGIWLLIDMFSIPGYVRDYNNRLAEALSRGGPVVLPRK